MAPTTGTIYEALAIYRLRGLFIACCLKLAVLLKKDHAKLA